MPAITWNKVNNRILVIGKFSQNVTFQDGGRLKSKSFIDEIQPGYYREYADDAILFDGQRDAFGGFRFAKPSEPHRADAIFVPIEYRSPLLELSAGNGTIVEWAKKSGKAAYAKFYEQLLEYQKTISDPKFCADLLSSAKEYVEKNIKTKKCGSSGAKEINGLVNTNILAVLTYLFAPHSGLPLLSHDNEITAAGVAECLKDFKTFGASQNAMHFFTLLHEICVFLADPVSVPSVLLWMIAERGEHIDELGAITDTPHLHRIAEYEFPKINKQKIKVDFAVLSGQSLADLTNPEKEICELDVETVKTTTIVFAGEAQSVGLDALRLSPAYSRRAFQQVLVDDYSAASVVVSKAGEKVLRAVKAFAEKVLKNPLFNELAATYWNQGKCITDEADIQKLAAILGETYTKEDWEEFCACDIAGQVKLFFKKYRRGLVSKMVTPVEQNLEELKKTQIKSNIIFGAMLYSSSPHEKGFGLMPLPTPLHSLALENQSAHDWLNTYFTQQIFVIKEKVLQVAEDATTDIQRDLLELHQAGKINLSDIRLFVQQNDNDKQDFPLLAVEEQQNTQGAQSPESERQGDSADNTGSRLEQGLKPLYSKAGSERTTKIIFQNKEGKPIDWEKDFGKPEITKALAQIETCYEVARDDATLRAKSKEWFSDSFQLISGKNDKGKSIPDGIEKYALPLLLGNIISTLPKAVVNFGEKHVAQEYMLLWKLVKEYGDPKKDAKDKLANIRFEEVFPIGEEDHLDKVFLYFEQRCNKVLELADYAKRIDDLETLAKSDAEVWVIDDTLDDYAGRLSNKKPLFWEIGFGGQKPVVEEAHVVFVTEEAGGIDQLTQYLPTAVNKIAYYPLFFFEKTALVSALNTVFPDFMGLSITDIPSEVDKCKWISETKVSPLLLLATSLLISPLDSGAVTYSGPSAFKKKKFADITEANFKEIFTFSDIYKQLWCFDGDLAETFLRNRLRNIARRGELDSKNWKTYFASDKWQDKITPQITAFDVLPLLKTLVNPTVDDNNAFFGYVNNGTDIGFPIRVPLLGLPGIFVANNLRIGK